MAVDKVASGITLAASLLSLIGTAFILSCYLVLPHKKHIRHALIVNLTFADFINAANNSVSGLAVLITNTSLTDGDPCIANGFVGQLSVQTVDCSVLVITIVTLWVVKSPKVLSANTKMETLILICASAWVLPVITSSIALFKGWYHPAAVNWCWIQDHPIYLRYALTHGWRFLIIFLVTSICIYIQIFLHRHVRKNPTLNRHTQVLGLGDIPYITELEGYKEAGFAYDHHDDLEENRALATNTLMNSRFAADYPPSPLLAEKPQPRKLQKRPSPQKSPWATSVEKTMLLNAYPIFYIILWIPGLANRIAEATGHEIYTLQIMQASTQLIGFANAVTFGWNEHIGKHIVARLREKWQGTVGSGKRWEID